MPLATKFHTPKIVSETDRPEVGLAVLSMICRNLKLGKEFSFTDVRETSEDVSDLAAILLAQAHVRGGVRFAKHGHERSLREPRYGAAVVFFKGDEVLLDQRAFRAVLKKVKAPPAPLPSREWPIKIPKAAFLSVLESLPPVQSEASQSTDGSG